MTTPRFLFILLLGILPLLAACERSQVDETDPTPQAQARKQTQQQQLEAAAQDLAAHPASGGGGGGGGGGSAKVNVEPIKVILGTPDESGVAPATVPAVKWDFSVERSPKNVSWPADKGENNYYTLEGDFKFGLKLKDGTHIDQHVRQVNARRQGTLIEGIETTSHPQSTDDTFQQTQHLMGSLGFGNAALNTLNDWHAKAQKGQYDNLELKTQNADQRVFTLHIINDGTSELPWSIGLDIDWSKVCGCHG